MLRSATPDRRAWRFALCGACCGYPAWLCFDD